MEAREHRGRADGGQSLAAVVLGNDAVLAARPATPAQLVRACAASGFDLVIPPSWGDELVAMAYIEALGVHAEPVAIACACPRVASLVGTTSGAARGQSLVPSAPRIAVAAPPVAVARALRKVHGEAILITFVGDCPSADDAVIDVRFSPAALFSQLERQGIALSELPDTISDAQLDRWRRHLSTAGGLPALRYLARPPAERVLRVVTPATLAAGNVAPSRSRMLLDLTDAAHCACGGQRDRIADDEPARSPSPVVQRPPGVDLGANPTPVRQRIVSLKGPVRSRPADGRVTRPASDETQHTSSADAVPASGGRSQAEPLGSPRTTSVGPEALAEAVPASATVATSPEKAPAPANVAHERAHSVARSPAVTRHTLASALATTSVGASAAAPGRRRRVLMTLPAVVVLSAAALGLVVYGTGGVRAATARSAVAGEPGRRPSTDRGDVSREPLDRRGMARPTLDTDANVSPGRGPGGSVPAEGALTRQRDSVTAATGVEAADSARAAAAPRGTAAARRAARRQPVVVPGWLPQGRATFTPIDTARAADSTRRRSPPDTARHQGAPPPS